MFICDFHREQAWDCWLRKAANGCVENRPAILCLLRSIARADKVDQCEKAIATLKISSYSLENSNLGDYLSRYWLTIKEVILGCCNFLQQLSSGMKMCQYSNIVKFIFSEFM